MIRTRWLVTGTVAIVVAIGGLVYVDETARSDAALVDLGAQQARIAQAGAAAIAIDPARGRAALGDLSGADATVAIRVPGQPLHGLDGRTIAAPAIIDAIERGAGVVRLEPRDAPALGLPERTAMVGLAKAPDGTVVAIAISAEHQRDRDREGRRRVVLSVALATGLLSALAALLWRQQRAEAVLARELAVAETARSRDAELDRLNRAATMAALGGGVAHELATPLGVIALRAEQLRARVAGDERAVAGVTAILEQADYADRVVRGLLGLARGAPIALTAVGPRALVRDAAALVEHRFQRAHVHLVPAVGEGLPDVRCEPLLFKHALVNLMLNACDASPAGATVRVEVYADAAEVAFVVTDDGEGIDPQIAARALEPFFTTKPRGTGLGLAIANEIAKIHRGALALAPRSPRGTRASLTLPIEGGVA